MQTDHREILNLSRRNEQPNDPPALSGPQSFALLALVGVGCPECLAYYGAVYLTTHVSNENDTGAIINGVSLMAGAGGERPTAVVGDGAVTFRPLQARPPRKLRKSARTATAATKR
jgi:hypothetical protein